MTGKNSKTPAVAAGKNAAKNKQRRMRQKMRKAQGGASSTKPKAGSMAPVNVGAKVRGQSGRAIREQGTDHMFNQDVSSAKTGVITQQVIMPALFPRMAQLAKSFQRIKYHRLRFEIVTGTTTSNAGVYVAGFVADATDPVSDTSVSATLLASGGEATKYWQSTEVVVTKFPPELFYTNPHEGEPRWSSPGSLVIASISAPTDKVTFEVFCHWDVTFSSPTYDAPGKSEDKSFKVMVDVYTSKGNKYLSKRVGNDWAPLSFNDFQPYPGYGVYILGHWRCGSVQDSSGTLDGNFGFFAIKVEQVGATTLVYPVDEKLNHTSQNFHAEEYVLRKGELVFHETSLSRFEAPWYHCPVSPSPSYQRLSPTYLFPGTSREYWTTSDSTIESSLSELSIDASSTPAEAGPSGLASSAKSTTPYDQLTPNLVELLGQAISSALSDNLTVCQQRWSERSSTHDPPPLSRSLTDMEFPSDPGTGE